MKDLYKALADFQQEVPVIHKGTEGYGYSYADLTEILKVINPLLKKHGLGFTQLLEGTKLKTIVFHSESSESIESSVDIPSEVTLKGMNDFQVLGSAITYLRRYSLAGILGLVTDKDTDAGGQQTSTGNRKTEGTIPQKRLIKQLMDAKGYTVADMAKDGIVAGKTPIEEVIEYLKQAKALISTDGTPTFSKEETEHVFDDIADTGDITPDSARSRTVLETDPEQQTGPAFPDDTPAKAALRKQFGGKSWVTV